MKLFARILPLVFLSVPLQAAVVVDSSNAWDVNANSFSENFDASSASKLVLAITGEHGFPGNAGGDSSNVTYNGQPLTRVINRTPVGTTPTSPDQNFNHMWYLDNPGDYAGTGVVAGNLATRGNVTAFALSNSGPGIGATAVSINDPSNSVDLTTTRDGAVVIVAAGFGGNGNTAVIPNDLGVDPASVLTLRSSLGNRFDSQATATGVVATAGPGTYGFTSNDGDIFSGSNVIALEVPAIPEPSSMALFGLGGIGLLFRRRR